MIAVCIPAFNEEKTIAKVILGAKKHAQVVFVCDDGSMDMTSEIAEGLGATVARHDRNLGKGVALKTLFKMAKSSGADVIVTMDADGQHDPADIPKVTKPIIDGETDIVNGSRSGNGNKIPAYRRLGNRALSVLTNFSTNSPITDTQSGFRAYSLESLGKITISVDGLGVDSEILMNASRIGLRIMEVPIAVSYDEKAKRNPVFHGVDVTSSIIKVVVHRHPGLYLGLPGFIALTAGVFLFITLLSLYNETQYFSIPIALLSGSAIIVGIMLAIAALILFAMSDLRKKIIET